MVMLLGCVSRLALLFSLAVLPHVGQIVRSAARPTAVAIAQKYP